MKCIKTVIVAAALCCAFSSCATVTAPVSGVWITDIKAPADVTSASGPATKKGEAICKSILGLIAIGDCSIDTAAKNGGIQQIHHVDYQAFQVFGFYAHFQTIVYGE